jgi:SAM-dependent methyltransferase
MPQPLEAVLAEVRDLLLDPALTRAVAAGRRRGQTPSVSRAELRPVALKGGPKLQIVTDDGSRPYTRNLSPGAEAAAAVDALLAEPFGNWHVETAAITLQVRVTKKGDAQVHRAPTGGGAGASGPRASTRGGADASGSGASTGGGPEASGPRASAGSAAASGPRASAGSAAASGSPASAGGGADATGSRASAGGDADPSGSAQGQVVAQGHDRPKQWLLDPGDPLFKVVGGTAAKRRQVDAFLRALAATLPGDPAQLPSPLRVVDLGCGNAYLTFAAYRYLADLGAKVQVVGVDVREDQRVRNTAVAAELGCADDVTFVAGTIEDAQVDVAPDLVLALHACDTATDQALARAIGWNATWVLAAPCCHHDIAAQLKGNAAPSGFAEVARQAILRERFADVLTDSLRASLLRLNGYKVDVVEFVDSAHTPRNLLLRARRTGRVDADQRAEYEGLTSQWGVTPALETMLAAR